MKIAFIDPNLHGEFRANLGLAALLTYIKKRTSHLTDLIDVTFKRDGWKQYVHDKIVSFQPDVIGFSCLTFNFIDALQILRYIKSFSPDVFVVFGGVHPTIQPENTIKHRNIDAICIGEGEYTLTGMLDALQGGQSLAGINGLWYKDGNKIIRNEKSTFIQNLDDLPFIDWSDFELELYQIINPYEINMLGSRGCPYNCSYCLNTVLRDSCNGKYTRFRTPEHIIEEMEYQLRAMAERGLPHLRYFYFWDDMFNLRKDFVENFCHLYKNNPSLKNTTWSCSSRVDTISEERMQLLSSANLNLTRIGVESGSNYIRKEVYHKNFTTTDAIKAINTCKKYNIHTQTDFIIGGPKETVETIKQTFVLMDEIDPSQISLNVFQPFPMLEASRIFKEDGGKVREQEWNKIKTLFLNTTAIHNRIKKCDLVWLTFIMNLYYIRKVVLKYLFKQRIRFLFDILKFSLYLKWKHKFLWHDLFKYTIRKYIYEDNLKFIKKIY